MGTCVLFKSFFLMLLAKEAVGRMPVRKKVKEKAESLYNSNPLREPWGNPRDRPVSELGTCLEDVFDVPFPPPPATKTTTTATITTTTQHVTSRCIYTDGNGTPEVRPKVQQRQRRSRQLDYEILDDEISTFHQCICLADPSDDSHPCYFNFMKTGYNRTVLNASLGKDKQERARLTYRRKEFHCRFKEDFIIVCRVKRRNVPDNDTKFQDTLVCLSNALEPHLCEAIPATPPYHPIITTGSSSAAQGSQPFPASMIILILGCALCLLLGILGTACCVVCWRNRRKRLKNRSMVKRTGRQAQLNSYSGNVADLHIYDELPDTGVPDLLQQRPPSPVHSRFGSERSVFVNPTQRSVSYSSSTHGSGYYEPLSRRDEECPLPTKPIPQPRWQFSIVESTGPNDYLDLVEESNQEDQTGEEGDKADHTYFVLEQNESNPENASKTSNCLEDEYVDLQDGSPADPAKDVSSYDKRSSQTSNNTCSSVNSDVKAAHYHVLEKSDVNMTESVSKAETSDSEEDTDEAEASEISKCLENDDYEVPVAEVTEFDLASSFKVSGGSNGRKKRRYKDYQTILPVADDISSETKKTEDESPQYFVLEV